jgi:hypothetical protein
VRYAEDSSSDPAHLLYTCVNIPARSLFPVHSQTVLDIGQSCGFRLRAIGRDIAKLVMKEGSLHEGIKNTNGHWDPHKSQYAKLIRYDDVGFFLILVVNVLFCVCMCWIGLALEEL